MGRSARPPEVREPIMNVGDAAQRSGLPAKTIRYYEEIGLIRPQRAGNGYRDYSGDDIHRLTFLRRARNLGFSIDDCRQLMALYQDRSRASHDVREIAAALAALGSLEATDTRRKRRGDDGALAVHQTAVHGRRLGLCLCVASRSPFV